MPCTIGKGATGLRVAVLSTQNTLLSGSIVKYLQERGELLPQRVADPEKVLDTVEVLRAGVLLMEVTRLPQFSLEARLETVRQIRARGLPCKVALLCDENADRETAEKVKDAKKIGLIDCFFYASVSGEYLSAVLDSL